MAERKELSRHGSLTGAESKVDVVDSVTGTITRGFRSSDFPSSGVAGSRLALGTGTRGQPDR